MKSIYYLRDTSFSFLLFCNEKLDTAFLWKKKGLAKETARGASVFILIRFLIEGG
jgi:hypothetical protein